MNKGYTLLELLIAIVIIAIAVTIVALSFSKLNKHSALDKSADLVVSVLNEARALTLASKGGVGYGVNLQESQVVLFQGSSYATTTSTNVFTALNSLIGIRNIYLAGSSTSVVFKRLTGSTDQAGTVEIYLKDSPAEFKRVTINGTGVVERN